MPNELAAKLWKLHDSASRRIEKSAILTVVRWTLARLVRAGGLFVV